METLEKIWEAIGAFFDSMLGGFARSVTAVFGSANARQVKGMQSKVDAINERESHYKAMTDEELRRQTEVFRERLDRGETLDDILVDAFAVCREGGIRFLGMRHYDVQLVGGMVLHSGAIAEMVTGEGKTLVATLPTYLNAIEGKGVHVVTVNDYLARRDMEWMAPLYMGLGLTVGAIQSDMSTDDRQKAYAKDITYGTNNEFGFDYLRDNMRPAARDDDDYDKYYQQSQGPLNYAVIDEVDNILIDEARTPLIISGPAHDNPGKYSDANRVAKQLKKDEHFVVNEKDHTASLTDEGVRQAEKLAGVESFYTAGNMEWPHLIDNALKAYHLYKRDVNYVVEGGKIVIVDEFTGRKMEGRQWSDGLHQAVESKEGVKIKEETQTLATVTLQNFFKLYKKISGMTGTAMTEANEFWKIYELDVVAIPTNREMKRLENNDSIYRTEKEKYIAVADEIEKTIKYDVLLYKDGAEVAGEILADDADSVTFLPVGEKQKEVVDRKKLKAVQRRGRPVLVGTVSIEKSERVSNLLNRRGVKHEVLNAKYHKREAEIVAQAGREGAVTIATNMAGRGTDIILGGNPDTMAWAQLQDKYATRLDVPREEWDALVQEIDERDKMSESGKRIKELGGLHVIGTERHDARRIDLQLRGRCGRQGDPGSSRFYLSLEDDLMRIFAGEWVKKILDGLGMADGEAIESKMVSRRIEAAQKKREERNFEVRKELLEYDEVMDEQRKRTYSYRQQILDGHDTRDLVRGMIEEQVEHNLDMFLQRDFGVETFAKWAGAQLSANLESPRTFRGADINTAESIAKDEAVRQAESEIFGAIEENLPDGEEDSEQDWNWAAMAKFVNTRYKLNHRDSGLKKIGRKDLAEKLTIDAEDAINRVDLSEGAAYLDEDFGLRTAVAWAKHKFDLELDLEEVKALESSAFKQQLTQQAIDAYTRHEAAYPVLAAMSSFTARGGGGQPRLDREGLCQWSRDRFEADIDVESLKKKQPPEIREELVRHAAAYQKRAEEVIEALPAKVANVFDGSDNGRPHERRLEDLAAYCLEKFRYKLPVKVARKEWDADKLEIKVTGAASRYYHREMRRMERQVLLQIVDTAWKDHLLAMDYLRSAVGLKGWAQMDPKVEYKREGMRLFEQVWQSIGERVTDLVLKMEQLDENFVNETFTETAAIHEEAPSDIEAQQQAGIEGSKGGDKKIEPIRNRGEQTKRNDPCPCNSGKKYKNCCLKNRGRNIA